MVFSSIIFIFYFLPITFILYYISPKKIKNLVFLAMSIAFYTYAEPKVIFLLLGIVLIDYFTMINYEKIKYRKILFYIAVISNLGALFAYKYLDFAINSTNQLFGSAFSLQNIALPLGISFFTFQSLSYVFDVTKNRVKAQKSIIKLGLYIFAFPQLVAGPIVRYDEIVEQIDTRTHSFEKISVGIKQFILGLAKKVLISNALAVVVDEIFRTNTTSSITAWIGIICYAMQIFYDFSGYSDMAIGLGKMFGFSYPKNFDYPYISKSVSEFWRRWHITLGAWFKDYVYFPLGGTRVSQGKVIRNLCIVWILTGLWHGANITFLAWGMYYCIFIVLEKVLPKIKIYTPIKHIYTLIVVCVGWVFFRSNTIHEALNYLQVMFTGTLEIQSPVRVLLHDNRVEIICGLICCVPIFKLFDKVKCETIKLWGEFFLIIVLFYLVLVNLVNSTYNPFIYFNF